MARARCGKWTLRTICLVTARLSCSPCSTTVAVLRNGPPGTLSTSMHFLRSCSQLCIRYHQFSVGKGVLYRVLLCMTAKVTVVRSTVTSAKLLRRIWSLKHSVAKQRKATALPQDNGDESFLHAPLIPRRYSEVVHPSSHLEHDASVVHGSSHHVHTWEGLSCASPELFLLFVQCRSDCALLGRIRSPVQNVCV